MVVIMFLCDNLLMKTEFMGVKKMYIWKKNLKKYVQKLNGILYVVQIITDKKNVFFSA